MEELAVFTQTCNGAAYFMAFIALIIVFFALRIQIKNNIQESKYQFAILRSMGITQEEGCRIYMYEAFLIVFTSCLIGTILGYGVAVLITLQGSNALQLTVEPHMPWPILGYMYAVSVVICYLSVKLPFKQMEKQKIGAIMKSV